MQDKTNKVEMKKILDLKSETEKRVATVVKAESFSFFKIIFTFAFIFTFSFHSGILLLNYH